MSQWKSLSGVVTTTVAVSVAKQWYDNIDELQFIQNMATGAGAITISFKILLIS